MGAGPVHVPAAHAAGNPVSTRQLFTTLLAISLGTVIEWYDYSIYSQLSKVLGKVFFPPGDAAVQSVSFWGLFAVGFLSRPIGAVLFGHLGDTRGRGLCLLLSVLLMGIPTVLIGCLPGYATIGIAAPILLAFLRLVQGLAMGGEFGAGMTYLVELASPRYKAITGSLGYMSLGAGVVLGILVVAATVSTMAEDALLVWGWRVPFLLSIVTLAVATVLRYNMPESAEFSESAAAMDAAVMHRAVARRGRRVSKADNEDQAARVEPDAQMCIEDTETGGTNMVAGSGGEFSKRVHYVPVVELFRGYWLGLLLHSLYGSWLSASFLIGYSWLPSFLAMAGGLPHRTTLWMVLSCMVLFTAMVPISGWVADSGAPRLVITIAISLASAAAAVPMFMGFRVGSLALSWVLQAVLLAMAGYAMGMLPAIVSAIYPAGVRISGCNLGVNISSTIGGVCPLIITAIQAATGSMYNGPAIVLAATGVLTAAASAGLMRYYPAANRSPAAAAL